MYPKPEPTKTQDSQEYPSPELTGVQHNLSSPQLEPTEITHSLASPQQENWKLPESSEPSERDSVLLQQGLKLKCPVSFKEDLLEVKEHLPPLKQELIDIQHSPVLLNQASVELQCASESPMQDPAQMQTLSEEAHSKVTEFQESPQSVELDPTEPAVLQKLSSPSQPNIPNLQPSSPDVSRTDLSENQESQPSFHRCPADLLQSLTHFPIDSTDMALTATPASPVEDNQSSAHETSTKAKHGPIQLADTSCSPREPNPEDKLVSPEAPSSRQLDEPSSCSGEIPPEAPAQFQLRDSECSTETRPAGPSSPVISVGSLQLRHSPVQAQVPLPPSPAQHPEVTLEQEDPVPTNPTCLQPEAMQELSTLDQELSSTSSLSTHASQKFTDSAPCSPSPALHRPTQYGGSQQVGSPQPSELSAYDPLSPQCTAPNEFSQKSPLRESTELETLNDCPMQVVHDEQTLERSDVCPATVLPEEISCSQDGDSQIVPVEAIPVQSSSALSLDKSSPQSQFPTPESLVHRIPSEEHSSLRCSPGQQSSQNLLEEKPADPLEDACSAGFTPRQGVISHHRESAEPPTSSVSFLQPEEPLEVELSEQFLQVNRLAPSPSRPSNPSDSLVQVIVVPTESSNSSSVGLQESTGSTSQSSPHHCQTIPFHTRSWRSTSTSPLPVSSSPQHLRPTETSAASICEGQRPSDVESLHSPPRSINMTSSCSGSPAYEPRSPCDVCISPPHSPPQADKMHCSPPHDSGPTLDPTSNLAQGNVVASPIKPDNDGPPAVDNLDISSVEQAGDHSLFPATSLPDRPWTPDSCRASLPDPSPDGSTGRAALEGLVHRNDDPVTSSPTQETSLFTPQGAASLAVSPQSAKEPTICSPVGSVTEPSPRPISPVQPADGLKTLRTPTAEEEQQQQGVELKEQEQDEEQSAAHSGE